MVNWYFRGQEVNDHLYEVWSNDEYDSVADAQLSVEPLLPELITSHAFLCGRIIVQVSATTGYVESAFVRVFQSTQVTNHNDLLGLQGGGPGEYYQVPLKLLHRYLLVQFQVHHKFHIQDYQTSQVE